VAREELFSWTKVAPTLAVIFVSPAILTVGCTMGMLVPFWFAVGTSIVAGATISLLIYLHGGAGAASHLSFAKLMDSCLGTAGSRFLASPLIALTQMGWFSVLITLGGGSASAITGIDRAFTITVFGAATAIVTFSGFSRLSRFTKVTSSLTAAFALWSLREIFVRGVSFHEMAYDPASFLFLSGLAIGGATSISTVSPDFVKSAKTKKDMRITAFGIVLPAMMFTLVAGNVMGAFTLMPDPVSALAVVGLPALANILLLLGSAAAASSLYPPSLALANIFKVKRNIATIPAAIGGIFLAYLGIVDQLSSFLRLIGILLPPLIGINIAEYYLISKRKPSLKPGINSRGVFSWTLGAATGLLPFGIPPINAIFASLASYLLVNHFCPPKPPERCPASTTQNKLVSFGMPK